MPIGPVLLLSSDGAGWDGLLVQLFDEPRDLEDWIAPSVPDISLVLAARGAMHMEQRYLHGPWRGLPYRQGDLILTPGRRGVSELRWHTLSAESMHTLHLQLNRDLFARTAEEATGADPARLELIGRVAFQDPLLAQIALALWRELEQPTLAGKLYVQTAAQMLAMHLLCHYTDASVHAYDPPRGLTRRQVQRVADFILAHLNQDLSLDALAQQAGFSAYHFARLFRQTTGESPHQLVMRLRVERAQQLLRTTDAPIAHIAVACGFANQSHLSRIFVRQVGRTPRAYRRDQ
jgi:AraC family transcriptional regulator